MEEALKQRVKVAGGPKILKTRRHLWYKGRRGKGGEN